jgi:hypothetical protein
VRGHVPFAHGDIDLRAPVRLYDIQRDNPAGAESLGEAQGVARTARP